MWSFDKFPKGVYEAMKRGLLTIEDIDRAARRFLLIKFQVGLFDNPYVDEDKPAKVLGCKEHRQLALKAARQALVLLSNPNKSLPLAGVKNLTVIGPNADVAMNQLGDYTAVQHREDIITILDGLKKMAQKRDVKVSYAKGCKVRSLNREGFKEALEIANKSDSVVFKFVFLPMVPLLRFNFKGNHTGLTVIGRPGIFLKFCRTTVFLIYKFGEH